MQAISSQMILSDGTLDLNGATLIPIELNGRVITKTQTISIVELGKRLLKAASDGDTELVKELMGKGAPFTTDWLGTGPLHFAAMKNRLQTCEVLLRAGISRDARTKVDRTPLHMATYEGHASIVEALLLSGAEVDARDMLKMTPLHWAVQNGHADVVNLLLRSGADPDAVSKFDKTPMDIALEMQRMDIMEMLQYITKDTLDGTQNLAIELRAEHINLDEDKIDDSFGDKSNAIHMENIEEIDSNEMTDMKQGTSNIELTDSLQMLREHGISFLPNDESSVVASAVENGHSLVLTDVGRQVLNSTKPLVKIPIQKTNISKVNGPKIITVTTDQLLAMAGAQKNIYRRIPNSNVITAEKPVKKIVMNKNKIIISGAPNVVKRPRIDVQPDIESITRQLMEARKLAEEYKVKLKRKEAEAERYKRQLQSMTQSK